MGLFKSIKKAFKKVTSGIKKVFKKTLSAINKVQKKIRKSKLFKALVIAGAVIVTGGAAIGAFTGGTATGWAGWMMNASNTIAGGTLFGTGATGLAGTAQAAGNFVTSAIAAPFAAVGAAAGTTAAAATDFVGLTTEASRVGLTPAMETAMADAQIAAGVSNTTGPTTLLSQEQAANAAAQTAGASKGTMSYLQQKSANTAATYGVPSAEIATAGLPTGTASQSLTERYPKTTSFVTGAGMTAANTMFGAYANSLYQGDARINPGGSAEEGASRFSPIAVYSNELNINPDDYYKHFTFSNASEASNMPLFQQQTLAIT
tara:strand:- start:812 stop:1765 length:954 start_codon:yes stop_codon:yes gene_type:complete